MKSVWKKAQTATEYLIILAVVIIIALIVVGVLGGIPGIGGGTGTNINSAAWQTSTIGIDSLAVSASGDHTLVVRNNNPFTITLDDIAVNTTVSNVDASGDLLNGGAINTSSGAVTSVTLSAGGTATLTIDGTNNNGIDLSCTSGSDVTWYFIFNYTNTDTSASYSFDNSDTAFETTCAS